MAGVLYGRGCRHVIETIFEWVEIITEYVIYVLKWVFWVID